MKSKTFIVYILTFILLVSMMNGFSFAAESTIEEAIKLGIIDAPFIKTNNLNQNTDLTRFQVANVYLRALGLQETLEKEDYTAIDNFQDGINLNENEQKTLLYIKMHPELGWIGKDNQFLPLEKVTQQQYLKVLLTLLGYKYGVDYQWGGTDELAKAIGFEYNSDMNKALKLEDVLRLTLMAFKINTKNGIKLQDVFDKEDRLGEEKLSEIGILKEKKLIINAIQIENMQSFRIEFGDKIDNLLNDNISVLVEGELKKIDEFQLSEDGYSANLLIPNLNYEDSVTFQFINTLSNNHFLDSEQVNVKLPSFEDTYQVKLVSSDPNSIVKSDGESSTDVLIQVINQFDGSVVPLGGMAYVSGAYGLLDQNYIAIKNGQGVFEVRSTQSISEEVSNIEVSLFSVPTDQQFEGLTNQIELIFSPDESVQKRAFVMPVAVYANEVDRVGVAFSDDVDAIEFKEQMVLSTHQKINETWSEFVISGDARILIDNQETKIVDIVQQSSNSLEFLLDTEYYPTDGEFRSINPGTQVKVLGLNKTSGSANILADNSKHCFSLSANIGSLVMTDFNNIEFYVNDKTSLEVEFVEIINDSIFKLVCSKNISETIVEGLRNSNGDIPSVAGINDHFTIDGKKVYLINNPNEPATLAERLFAKQNNLILLKELYVGGYDCERSQDDRNSIYCELDSSEPLFSGTHTVKVSNIGDWASDSDRRNILSAQTLQFTVVYDSAAPTVTIAVMSPEQWLLTFSEPVQISGQEWIEITLGNTFKSTLEQDVDYSLSNVWNPVSRKTEVLIEFTKDWTVYFDELGLGINYWDPKNNTVQVNLEGSSIQDYWGNQFVTSKLMVNLFQDFTAPDILEVIDLYNANQSITSGREIKITFSEPIQIVEIEEGQVISEYTPSVKQTNEVYNKTQITFTQNAITINGFIKKNSINSLDTAFVVVPESQLGIGEWFLHCENVMDDSGNYMITKGVRFQVSE